MVDGLECFERTCFLLSRKRWIPVFWDMTHCQWVSSSKHFKGTYCLILLGSRGPWRL